MGNEGWKHLLQGWPWFVGEGAFPLFPNSEYMQPVRVLRKPYGHWDPVPIAEDDPYGWPVGEYEEHLVLRPGLKNIAAQVVPKLVELCETGKLGEGVAEFKLRENPYWPKELAKYAGQLTHERYVLLLPLALSVTQDDKAILRWSLFGNSEQGPSQAFWRSFFLSPHQEVPGSQALGFFRKLLADAYDEPRNKLVDLRSAGLRILRHDEKNLPSWAEPLLLGDRQTVQGVRYLLTFRPFEELPPAVRRKYLAGELHLLPFPGSLLFWGVPAYARLKKHMPFAMQIPLLHFVERHGGLDTVRIPQAGWFREDGPDQRDHSHITGPFRTTYKRTHRTHRVPRYHDELVAAREHHLAHVMFSTRPKDIDLYYKPMARNVQLWTSDFQLLLDGPRGAPEQIRHAAEAVANGGVFGYRFQFPPMHVGSHEIYWQRPLVAWFDRRRRKTVTLPDALTGYLTGYDSASLNLGQPIELWPRFLQRAPHLANIELHRNLEEKSPRRTLFNVRKLLHAWELQGHAPLRRSFARRLMTTSDGQSLSAWLKSLPGKTSKPARGKELAEHVEHCLDSERRAPLPKALTYRHTANRAFEVAYWKTIKQLSSPPYVNKNNADCVLDDVTQAKSKHHQRDLDDLGAYLLSYYDRLLAETKMGDTALVGELPFRWHTEYAFPWMGGWVHNQEGKAYERNLLVVIPGRDRSRAVIMADHYDTAYMHDIFDKHEGGCGARLSAPGADDNCSATAALMLGARPFLELSRQGKLECDIWLVHLTGEEYPAEGLGACRLCQWLVERSLKLRAADGTWHDLSNVRIQGLYVLDMIAHNNSKGRNVFQISPGVSSASLWLAQEAHIANEIWNAETARWNLKRSGVAGRRSADGKTPATARHPRLRGEVRLHFDPRSTLFNTDGQAFSDIGVPVVLFMENYDIGRVGYHDAHDNMSLIDLDYGAALTAITIESVARVASQSPPPWAQSDVGRLGER